MKHINTRTRQHTHTHYHYKHSESYILLQDSNICLLLLLQYICLYPRLNVVGFCILFGGISGDIFAVLAVVFIVFFFFVLFIQVVFHVPHLQLLLLLLLLSHLFAPRTLWSVLPSFFSMLCLTEVEVSCDISSVKCQFEFIDNMMKCSMKSVADNPTTTTKTTATITAAKSSLCLLTLWLTLSTSTVLLFVVFDENKK